MTSHRCLLAVALAAVLATVGSSPAAGDSPSGEAGLEQKVATSINDFAFDMYSKLREEADGNLFFSPTSISTALAMTYAGARGETAAEMERTLRFPLAGENLHAGMGALARSLTAAGEGHRLSLANALWLQAGRGFLDGFLDLAERHYGAGAHELDFLRAVDAARGTINEWVEEATEGKIEDLLRPGDLSSSTELVLTNAIHFKGTWKVQFDEKFTREALFRLSSGGSVGVDTMHLSDASFRYARDTELRLQALELPYAGETASMVLLLPDQPDGIAELEGKLSRSLLDGVVDAMAERKLDLVAVPRFEVGFRVELAKTLAEMGMPSAFEAKRADFSGMTGARDLFIDKVIHQALVEVNEEGTEAAAATAVTLQRASVSPRLEFRADRPFVFLIRDNESGAILFLGRVMNPAEG